MSTQVHEQRAQYTYSYEYSDSTEQQLIFLNLSGMKSDRERGKQVFLDCGYESDLDHGNHYITSGLPVNISFTP